MPGLLAEAEELDAFWVELCESLGVQLNLRKRQRCSQSLEYAGFVFDTWRGMMLVQAGRLVKLLGSIRLLREAQTLSTRQLDEVKGRALHYSACVRHLRILVTELGRLVGTVDESDYDAPRLVTGELRELSCEMEAVVERYGEAGVPLWPPVASSAYAAFMRGDLGPEYYALSWDASTHGWAALLRGWNSAPPGSVLREELLVGTWPLGEDVSEQQYRECLAAPLALEAAARVLDLGGQVRSPAE
ncbi:hypothetical protein [Bradyrhizobium sp.]|uniref:hypothetical protein n=1 Tax=Bradyrhizobium sp. TaxID=376 RepID=UPI00391D19A9